MLMASVLAYILDVNVPASEQLQLSLPRAHQPDHDVYELSAAHVRGKRERVASAAVLDLL